MMKRMLRRCDCFFSAQMADRPIPTTDKRHNDKLSRKAFAVRRIPALLDCVRKDELPRVPIFVLSIVAEPTSGTRGSSSFRTPKTEHFIFTAPILSDIPYEYNCPPVLNLWL